MKTVKEILSENRKGIIEAIKYSFKTKTQQDLISKMQLFFEFATENECSILQADEAKNTTRTLQGLVARLAKQIKKDNTRRIFGTTTPKLSEILGAIEEREFEKSI